MKKDIFKLVSSIVKSRSIFHHYALLELEGDYKDFNHAKELLDNALSINYNTSERDELIFTSFGKLYSLKGYQLEEEGNLDEALDAYDLAEKYFLNGRSKNFKNKYSYHGQIVLNRRRVEKMTDSFEKVKLFSTAIQLCEDALSNLSQTDHPVILEQEAMLMLSIDKMDELDSIIERLANEYNSPAGYRLKGNILFKNSFELSGDHKYRVLDKAYKFAAKGLDIDNTDQGLLQLQAKIGIELFPTDIDSQYKILKKWYDFSDQSNLKLLFRYATILFELDYYEDSKNIFSELDFQSQGLPQRSSILKGYFRSKNGEDKKYHGIVKHLDLDGKKGFINCVSLPNLKYEIPFFPVLFSPTDGDYVIFEIRFNMRGIFGFNVRKD